MKNRFARIVVSSLMVLIAAPLTLWSVMATYQNPMEIFWAVLRFEVIVWMFYVVPPLSLMVGLGGLLLEIGSIRRERERIRRQ